MKVDMDKDIKMSTKKIAMFCCAMNNACGGTIKSYLTSFNKKILHILSPYPVNFQFHL